MLLDLEDPGDRKVTGSFGYARVEVVGFGDRIARGRGDGIDGFSRIACRDSPRFGL